MPIQSGDVKLLKSAVMADVPEGGGAPTGNTIADGVSNAIFPDISELDRAGGRVNLRKCFVQVATDDTDTYFGANVIVAEPPQDERVSVTLFSTHDHFDRRADAVNRVEAYLYKGPMWHGVLYSNHIRGMKAINVIQRVDTALPPVGKTLCLVHSEGLPGEVEQYVRVIDVVVTPVTFTDEHGDYTRWVVRMALSDTLRADFVGHTPNRYDRYDYTTAARLRDTNLADATRYFSTTHLRDAAAMGSLTVHAQAIFGQLVPSAEAETPLVNQPLNPSIILAMNAGSRTVDVPQQAHTLARQITVENRRQNWAETLPVAPAPGTLTFAYMSQGNWYVLTDDGAGALRGIDPTHGVGTLDYVTRALFVTLGALPDAGSMIVIVYGSAVHYTQRTGASALVDPVEVYYTTDAGASPGTLSITWEDDQGHTYTATADTSGTITGACTGRWSHQTGMLRLVFATLPAPGTAPQISYQRATQVVEDFHPAAANDVITLQLAQAPIRPGTTIVEITTTLYTGNAPTRAPRPVVDGTPSTPIDPPTPPDPGVHPRPAIPCNYMLIGVDACDWPGRTRPNWS